MTDRERAETIDDVAAVWAARVDRGLTPTERIELDTWLAIERRHVGAFARAQAVWLHAERAAALGPATGNDPKPAVATPNRRWILAGSAALAASVAATLIVPIVRNRPRELASNIGEVRRIALADGSAVTLDTGSRVVTSFTDQTRAIRLLSGEAYFEVAHDTARPFVVTAGEVVTRAVGTAFSVRLSGDSTVTVLVHEGRVAVSRPGRTTVQPTLLAANMGLVAPSDTTTLAPPEPLPPRIFAAGEVDRALAWREGMLAFEGEPLSDAARRFARYGGSRIAIDDPALAREPITGLFAANDPRGFARAVAVSLNARTTTAGDIIRITRSR